MPYPSATPLQRTSHLNVEAALDPRSCFRPRAALLAFVLSGSQRLDGQLWPETIRFDVNVGSLAPAADGSALDAVRTTISPSPTLRPMLRRPSIERAKRSSP